MRRDALGVLVALAGCNAPAFEQFTTWHPMESSSGSSGTSTSTGSTGTGTTEAGESSGTRGGSGTGAGGSSGAVATGEGSGGTTGEGTSGEEGSSGSGEGACSNGQVDAPGEECDDGNTAHDDRCDTSCLRNRVVFVTSEEFQPDEIGGLAGADSLCRLMALKGELENWKSFKAWLSDSKEDAGARIYPGAGRYFRTDGMVVAMSAAQFVSGTLLAPIVADEHGAMAHGGVWTGTRPDGTAVPGSEHCADWTDGTFFKKGYVGACAAVNGMWTQHPDPLINPTDCITAARLYCFEGE